VAGIGWQCWPSRTRLTVVNKRKLLFHFLSANSFLKVELVVVGEGLDVPRYTVNWSGRL